MLRCLLQDNDYVVLFLIQGNFALASPRGLANSFLVEVVLEGERSV